MSSNEDLGREESPLKILTLQDVERMLYEGRAPLVRGSVIDKLTPEIISKSFHNMEEAKMYAPFVKRVFERDAYAIAPYKGKREHETYLVKPGGGIPANILAHEDLHAVVDKQAGYRTSAALDNVALVTMPSQFLHPEKERAIDMAMRSGQRYRSGMRI